MPRKQENYHLLTAECFSYGGYGDFISFFIRSELACGPTIYKTIVVSATSPSYSAQRTRDDNVKVNPVSNIQCGCFNLRSIKVSPPSWNLFTRTAFIKIFSFVHLFRLPLIGLKAKNSVGKVKIKPKRHLYNKSDPQKNILKNIDKIQNFAIG